MKKKFYIGFSATIAMLMFLAACGGDSSSSADIDDSSSSSSISSSSSFEEESSDSDEEILSSSEEAEETEESSSSSEEESSSSERYAWQHLNKNLSYGELVDKRENYTVVYKTIKIGNHTWMAENMRVISSYSNETEEKYGRMFSGYQATCPEGWHIPSMAEWATLYGEDVLDGELWLEAGASEDACTDHINASGFSALPGGRDWNGYRAEADVNFLSADTTTYRNPSTGYYNTVYKGVDIDESRGRLGPMSNYQAFSVRYYVRCIMDPEGFDYIVNYLEKEILEKPEMECSEALSGKTAYVAHDYKKAVCKEDETTHGWAWAEEPLDWMIVE